MGEFEKEKLLERMETDKEIYSTINFFYFANVDVQPSS